MPFLGMDVMLPLYDTGLQLSKASRAAAYSETTGELYCN